MVEVTIVMLTYMFMSLSLQTHLGMLVTLCSALKSVMLVLRKTEVRISLISALMPRDSSPLSHLGK